MLSNLQTGALNDIGKGLAALALGEEPPRLTPSPPTVGWTTAERARWAGRFVNEHIATVELIDRGDRVVLRWADSPDTVLVVSVGPGRAYDRQDTIALTLGDDGGILSMRWGEGEPQEFKRLP